MIVVQNAEVLPRLHLNRRISVEKRNFFKCSFACHPLLKAPIRRLKRRILKRFHKWIFLKMHCSQNFLFLLWTSEIGAEEKCITYCLLLQSLGRFGVDDGRKYFKRYACVVKSNNAEV